MRMRLENAMAERSDLAVGGKLYRSSYTLSRSLHRQLRSKIHRQPAFMNHARLPSEHTEVKNAE